MTANGQEQEESSDTGEGWADTAPLLQKEESLSSENRGSASGSSSTLREGVHLIQIHRVRESSSSDGEIDPCSPDQPQCRICLDSDGDDELIAPCQCRGTQKFVHRACLDNWRVAKEGFAFAHCTECRAMFHLLANMPADRWWLRLKFQLLVVRDHAMLFIIVQMVVASMGMLVYAVYGDELREMFGYEQHPYSFYSLAIIVCVLVGLLYGFFIAIICGPKISNRHYHILAKQELTKEYVVQNLNDGEVAPPLDKAHITELQMLGLFQSKHDILN